MIKTGHQGEEVCCSRDLKTLLTLNYSRYFGQSRRANHGWYMFLCNLFAGDIRDFLFFTVWLFDKLLDRNHHYIVWTIFVLSKFVLKTEQN